MARRLRSRWRMESRRPASRAGLSRLGGSLSHGAHVDCRSLGRACADRSCGGLHAGLSRQGWTATADRPWRHRHLLLSLLDLPRKRPPAGLHCNRDHHRPLTLSSGNVSRFRTLAAGCRLATNSGGADPSAPRSAGVHPKRQLGLSIAVRALPHRTRGFRAHRSLHAG